MKVSDERLQQLTVEDEDACPEEVAAMAKELLAARHVVAAAKNEDLYERCYCGTPGCIYEKAYAEMDEAIVKYEEVP